MVVWRDYWLYGVINAEPCIICEYSTGIWLTYFQFPTLKKKNSVHRYYSAIIPYSVSIRFLQFFRWKTKESVSFYGCSMRTQCSMFSHLRKIGFSCACLLLTHIISTSFRFSIIFSVGMKRACECLDITSFEWLLCIWRFYMFLLKYKYNNGLFWILCCTLLPVYVTQLIEQQTKLVRFNTQSGSEWGR